MKKNEIKILLVDDVAFVRKVFRKLLEDLFGKLFRDLNPVIREASSAEEALLIMTRNNFDIIITDVSMPGMSGIEFLKQIKREHRKDFWNNRSFIVISASDSGESFEQSKKLGARFVPKDEPELFNDEVGKAVNKFLA